MMIRMVTVLLMSIGDIVMGMTATSLHPYLTKE